MSHFQVRWAWLMKSVEDGRLSDHRIGSLYATLTDANAVIVAARKMAHAQTQGHIAWAKEECGDEPVRSSESWFEEADECAKELYYALERLDHANSQGYPPRKGA
jgi:hypothetical protein